MSAPIRIKILRVAHTVLKNKIMRHLIKPRRYNNSYQDIRKKTGTFARLASLLAGNPCPGSSSSRQMMILSIPSYGVLSEHLWNPHQGWPLGPSEDSVRFGPSPPLRGPTTGLKWRLPTSARPASGRWVQKKLCHEAWIKNMSCCWGP